MASNDNNKISKDEKKQKKREEKIKPFLNANGITEGDLKTDGWYRLMTIPDVAEALKNVLDEISPPLAVGEPPYNSRKANSRVPAYNRVLKAFTLVPPKDVEVVVIGSAPALSIGSKGGVAFSSPQNIRFRGPAVSRFRQALRDAGADTEAEDELPADSCDLKKWAANRRVLLLNAGLTMENDVEGNKDGYYNKDTNANILYHCDLWKDFMTRLLEAWRNSLLETTDVALEESFKKINLTENDADAKNDAADPKKDTAHAKNDAADNRIHVLLLGHKDGNRNYAKGVWGTGTLDGFQVSRCHHPTFPRDGNNFNQAATKFFQQAFQ